MSSELDLRGVHQPHEADPAFVDALEQRLESILSEATSYDPAIDDRALIELHRQAPAALRAPRRSIILAVLGTAAAAALVAALGAIGRDDEPVSVEPSTTTPTAAPLANGWVAQQFGNEIWLVRPGETDRWVEYPNYGGAEACPAFSPDGERMMFGRANHGADGSGPRTPVGGTADAALEIVTVAADGSVSPLTTIPLDGVDAIPCAIWAPDGRWAALAGSGAVWVVDTETAEVRQIPGYEPRDLEWRPGTDELAITGRAVAGSFVGDNAPIDIYTVSTGEVRTVGDLEAAELTWSPDGTMIAYTQAVPGATNEKSGITLIDADGSNQRRLTTEGYVADHGIGVVWSPLGDQIAYQRERADCTGISSCDERTEVVLVSATDTDPANPIGTEHVIPALPNAMSTTDLAGVYPAPGQWHANSVTWSPDGTELLYTAGVRGLITVPVDAARPPILLSTDGLTGTTDQDTTLPWIPLQQWQPIP